jgi:hypothetical protein
MFFVLPAPGQSYLVKSRHLVLAKFLLVFGCWHLNHHINATTLTFPAKHLFGFPGLRVISW